jgi:hypothetical protein
MVTQYLEAAPPRRKERLNALRDECLRSLTGFVRSILRSTADSTGPLCE